MLKTIRCLVCASLGALAFAPWSAASAATEGQLMFIAAPSGQLYAAGAEFGGSSNTSFAVRAGGYSYSYKDGSYWEDGSGTLFGFTGRFYASKPMEGMFFGAGVNFVSGETKWGGWGYNGYTTYSGVSPHAMLGYKIRNGALSIEPDLFATLIPGEQVSVVVGAGLTIGVRF